jgi:hypothetical protein
MTNQARQAESEEAVTELVYRRGDNTGVVRGGFENQQIFCTVEDTGNGFIAFFPSHHSSYQDYYVCLDYSQARALVLGLSVFKEELGFDE